MEKNVGRGVGVPHESVGGGNLLRSDLVFISSTAGFTGAWVAQWIGLGDELEVGPLKHVGALLLPL